MKKIAIVAGLFFIFAGTAFGATLNFDSIGDATITFYGDLDGFRFLPDSSSGSGFQVTSVFGGFGALDPDTVGLYGNIERLFTIGTITQPIPSVDIFEAPVSGAGSLSIIDEAGIPFTANIEFFDINTTGSGVTLNTQGTSNITGISYSGANADLLNFLYAPAGVNAISVGSQFIPPKSLLKLTEDGSVASTSHSGSITAGWEVYPPPTAPVPEPGTMLLLGSGLVGLLGYGRKRLKK